MSDQEFVEVYTVTDPTQAEMLKNALEAEGIFCAIEGENQAGFTGVFEIRLFVPVDVAERARKFLEQHEA